MKDIVLKILVIIILGISTSSCTSNKDRLDKKLSQIRSLIENQKLKSAKTKLDILKSTAPSNVEIELLNGEIAFLNKNYNQTIKSLNALISSNQHDLKLWLMLMQAYRKRGHNKKALEIGILYLKKFDLNDEILLLISNIYLNLASHEEALKTLSKVQDKENINYLQTITKLYLYQQKIGLVVECYKQLLNKAISEEDKASYLTFIGKYNFIIKNYQMSREYFQQANTLNPFLFNEKVFQGICCHLLKEKKQSRNLFYSAFLLNPRNEQIKILLNGKKKTKDIILKKFYTKMENLYE